MIDFSFSYLKLGQMLVKLRFDQIWNEHQKFKKNQKNGKPVHMFLVCHILTTPIDKQGLDTFKQNMLECGVKSQISNYELSCVKRGGLWFATWNCPKPHQTFILVCLEMIQA